MSIGQLRGVEEARGDGAAMKTHPKSRRLTVKLEQPPKGGASRGVSFDNEVTRRGELVFFC